MDRHGFTLTELLVVIAAIAVLSGIMSPAMWSAKQQARSVACFSNVRQMGVALTIYEQSAGRFPQGLDNSEPLLLRGGSYIGDPKYDRLGRWWFEHLDGIVQDIHKEDSVAWCPSRQAADPGFQGSVLIGNYGVNRAICMDVQGPAGTTFVGRPLASAQIRHPAAVLLVADSGYSLVSWQAAADNMLLRAEGHAARELETYVPGLSINVNRELTLACRKDAIEGRHFGKKINAAFADGHAESVLAESVLVEDVGGAWQNRSPLWLP